VTRSGGRPGSGPRRRRAALACAALAAALLCARAGPALVVSDRVDAADVVVSLASHEWERLPAAAAIAQRFPASLLLLTMPTHPTETNCYRCDERLEELEAAGIARTRVRLLPTTAGNTYQEAEATLHYLAGGRDRGTVVVVTSPYHTRRARATFTHVLRTRHVDVRVVAAVSDADPRAWFRRADDRNYVAYEWTGLLYYAFRYGVPPTRWF
jgi:uncharacterized SAM-binding protein YcdF (DUF218 family)